MQIAESVEVQQNGEPGESGDMVETVILCKDGLALNTTETCADGPSWLPSFGCAFLHQVDPLQFSETHRNDDCFQLSTQERISRRRSCRDTQEP